MSKARSPAAARDRARSATQSVDFAAYRVSRNPFAGRVAKEGITFVVATPTDRRPLREPPPSRASLREMPEVDLAGTRIRANPYAARARAEGITLRLRAEPDLKKRRPDRASALLDVELPLAVWERLARTASERGVPVGEALRAAVLAWLGDAA
jgi:hypothetical protein